jgi:SAM-dependent methyltransferase
MTEKPAELTPPYARYSVRLTRPFPDFDFFFIKPLRRKAAGLLGLNQGDRVLDAGCGSGGSFPHLLQCVGSSGEVVGVEISPDTVVNATRRVEKNNWANIRIIEGHAGVVPLTGMFDGLLMFAAPDVYASNDALQNLFPHLRDNARVVFFGAKTSHNRFGRILNPFLRKVFSKLSFPETPTPDHEPWRIIERRLANLHIEEYFFGLMFLASGSVSPSRNTPDHGPERDGGIHARQ